MSSCKFCYCTTKCLSNVTLEFDDMCLNSCDFSKHTNCDNECFPTSLKIKKTTTCKSKNKTTRKSKNPTNCKSKTLITHKSKSATSCKSKKTITIKIEHYF